MADLSALTAAGSSLLQAGQIVQAMIGFKVQSEVAAKLIDLQNAIMTAQAGALAAQGEMQTMQAEIASLLAKLKEHEVWETESGRYQLAESSTGVMVYSLRQEAANGEPMHLICPNCFQNRRKTILQTHATHRGGLTVRCHPCDMNVTLTAHARPQVRNVSVDNGW